jgi:hypothetical protein
VTLEVLRDAAGTAAMPTGALATGFGGMAHGAAGSIPGGWPLVASTLVALGAIGTTIGLRRRDNRLALAVDQSAHDGT